MITENAEWTAKVFYLKTSRILVFALEILVEGTQNLENDSVTETVATAKLHLRWADQIRRWSVAGLPALTLERTGTIVTFRNTWLTNRICRLIVSNKSRIIQIGKLCVRPVLR